MDNAYLKTNRALQKVLVALHRWKLERYWASQNLRYDSISNKPIKAYLVDLFSTNLFAACSSPSKMFSFNFSNLNVLKKQGEYEK